MSANTAAGSGASAISTGSSGAAAGGRKLRQAAAAAPAQGPPIATPTNNAPAAQANAPPTKTASSVSPAPCQQTSTASAYAGRATRPMSVGLSGSVLRFSHVQILYEGVSRTMSLRQLPFRVAVNHLGTLLVVGALALLLACSRPYSEQAL